MGWISCVNIEGQRTDIVPSDIAMLAEDDDGDTLVGIKGLSTYVRVKDSIDSIQGRILALRNDYAEV